MVKMGKLYKILDGLKPMILMVIVQVSLTGLTVLFKLVGSTGMSLPILTAYCFLFASAAVVPLALILERNKMPKLTWKYVMYAFGCGLFGGTLAQNLFAESLVLTSATFVAAISNLVPAITFILALLFRMEELRLKTMAGKAKLMGTVLSIGGAMLFSFYKGFEIKFLSTNIDLLHKYGGHVAAPHPHSSSNAVLGLVLALLLCFSQSIGYIIQTKMSRLYPCPYASTALISIGGAVQAIVYALCIEKDRTKWRLGWNLTLFAAAYMGILQSGLMWVLTTIVVEMRGPLYVSVFNPLQLVLVALAASLFLNEKLHLGSVLGAVVIVCGLYLVLWGKGKEMSRLMASKNSTNGSVVVGASARVESFRGFSHASNVLVPDMIHPSQVLFDEQEIGEEDLDKS